MIPTKNPTTRAIPRSHKVPDTAIKEAGLRRFSDAHTDVAWMDPDRDESARSLEKK